MALTASESSGPEPKYGSISVGLLREVFRNYLAFRALYESEGKDTIGYPDGVELCLWDVEYLYSQLYRLPKRQREAIELCLIQNIREQDAAVMMGVSITNPVAMYATSGLKKLVDLIHAGALPEFRDDLYDQARSNLRLIQGEG